MPKKPFPAYSKLMDEGMQVLMGTVTSDPCIAVTDESSKDGILQITPSGSAEACAQYDNCFRICFTDPLQGRSMANYMYEEDVRKVAVIYDVSSDYRLRASTKPSSMSSRRWAARLSPQRASRAAMSISKRS